MIVTGMTKANMSAFVGTQLISIMVMKTDAAIV
jgi:hypothetical protein